MISVIVPFWNSEKWLGRCLESLTIQKGLCEFILVDDHSTDNGRDIAYEYCHKDMRFTLLSNTHLQGVGGARNTGIEYASGDYITFLDADDELLPNAIQIYEKLNTENIYQANHLRYYAKINKTARKYTHGTGVYDLNNLPPCWCMVWNKLYKREFLKDIRFNESMSFGEDELFNLECLNKNKRIFCVEADTLKRHFDNEHSLSKSKEADDLFKQAQELTKFLKRTNDSDMRRFVCRLLSEHWRSNTYLNSIAPPVADKNKL